MNTDTKEPLGAEIETTAAILYGAYCQKVGGKAFNGDPLPSWAEFSDDPSKTKQANAWRSVAQITVEACRISVKRAIDSIVQEFTKPAWHFMQPPTPDGGRDKERPILQ